MDLDHAIAVCLTKSAVEEGLEETGLDEDDTVQTVAALPCASDVEKDVVSAAIEKGAV